MLGCRLSAAGLTVADDLPEAGQGVWLRADPVRLQPDLAAVWLLAGARLAPEGRAACALKELFADHGLAYHPASPERGYLLLDEAPQVRFVPPWTVAGRSLDEVMPIGADAARWRRLLSEAQILLHQHAADDHASDSGTAANGLWLWGEGPTSEAADLTPRVRRVYAGDFLLSACARYSGLPCEQIDPTSARIPGSLIEWRPDARLDAGDNLEQLSALVARARRRLRLGLISSLELATADEMLQWQIGHAWPAWMVPGR